MKTLNLFVVLGLSLLSGTAWGAPAAVNKQTVTLESYKELQEYFQTYGYTYKIWRSGYRAVPRVYVTDVPDHWSHIADRVSLGTKKELFYSAVLPMVLRANEMIAQDRARAEPIAMRILAGQTVSDEERAFLGDLAGRYRIKRSSDVANPAVLQEILLRVDEIPPSLALAQAAFESAYATSRFAGLGNSLFGQETVEGKGMPAQGNEDRERPYHLEDFETPLGATVAYEYNLNTHKAYANFRKKRAEYRRLGKLPDSIALAMTLTKYSERGKIYTEEVAHVIRNLKLAQADMAYLRDMNPVYIIPSAAP